MAGWIQGERVCRHDKLLSGLFILLTAAGILSGSSDTALAVVITLHDRTKPQITIQVGSPGNRIDTVTFIVPNANPGDGTPIQGSEDITISLQVRASAATPITAFLSVDSATPLTNGRGGTIPISKIHWTASSGEIPSGAFAGTSNQLLASYSSSVKVSDQHTFYYDNDTVYDAGTYTGQVRYTWFVP